MADEGRGKVRKTLGEDLDLILRDLWSRLVEYAHIGAEEASRMSAVARVRVDMETLKFKRGQLLKALGEQYLSACAGNPDLGVKGTQHTLRQIRALDREIAEQEGTLEEVRSGKGERKVPASRPQLPPADPSLPRPGTTRFPAAGGRKVASERKRPRPGARRPS